MRLTIVLLKRIGYSHFGIYQHKNEILYNGKVHLLTIGSRELNLTAAVEAFSLD